MIAKKTKLEVILSILGFI